jgi:hypothetical protein
LGRYLSHSFPQERYRCHEVGTERWRSSGRRGSSWPPRPAAASPFLVFPSVSASAPSSPATGAPAAAFGCRAALGVQGVVVLVRGSFFGHLPKEPPGRLRTAAEDRERNLWRRLQGRTRVHVCVSRNQAETGRQSHVARNLSCNRELLLNIGA